MAGVGFTLRRLTNQDNLIGIFRAYTHATIVAAGPWLCTVFALGFISPFGVGDEAIEQMTNFQIIVVYNFVASLIFTAPVFMVVTRYLADCIHKKDVTSVPTLLLVSIGLIYLLLAPFALYFYGYYVDLPADTRLAAIANLYLVSLIWLLGVYISALQDYKFITRAFFIGMLMVPFFTYFFPQTFGHNNLLVWFNIGLAWIAFSLLGKILTEYPYRLVRRLELRSYFVKYWDLAVGGVVYNISIWIDKCVMWIFAPEAITLANKMTDYPHYDGAMFLAYLSVVPSMAIFLFSVETNFFIHYQKFYRDIQTHQTLATIRQNQQKIISSLAKSGRNFIVVQGTFTLVAILGAAQLFSMFKIPFLEIGIFRIGALGSFFHMLALFEMVILAYFDCRRKIMWLQVFCLCSNVLFTYISVQAGFKYYGYGYFYASLLTAAIASIVLFNHLQKLPYHTFITSNTSK